MKSYSTLVLVSFLDHSFISMKEKIKGMRRIMLEEEEGDLRVGGRGKTKEKWLHLEAVWEVENKLGLLHSFA